MYKDLSWGTTDRTEIPHTGVLEHVLGMSHTCGFILLTRLFRNHTAGPGLYEQRGKRLHPQKEVSTVGNPYLLGWREGGAPAGQLPWTGECGLLR